MKWNEETLFLGTLLRERRYFVDMCQQKNSAVLVSSPSLVHTSEFKPCLSTYPPNNRHIQDSHFPSQTVAQDVTHVWRRRTSNNSNKDPIWRGYGPRSDDPTPFPLMYALCEAADLLLLIPEVRPELGGIIAVSTWSFHQSALTW